MRLLASLVFSGYGAGIVPASAAPVGVGRRLAARARSPACRAARWGWSADGAGCCPQRSGWSRTAIRSVGRRRRVAPPGASTPPSSVNTREFRP